LPRSDRPGRRLPKFDLFDGGRIDITISPSPFETPWLSSPSATWKTTSRSHLKRRAAVMAAGMEDEVRQICATRSRRGATKAEAGIRIAARFAKIGLDEDLPELHGQVVRPAQFDS